VFIVVLAVIVVTTVVAKGPVIFLKFGENQVGQFDGIFYSSDVPFFGLPLQSDQGVYLDYDKIITDTSGGADFNLSPRNQFAYLSRYSVTGKEEI
jgi:hypothetical protein